MKDRALSLDDLALFLAVCDAGGLAGAVAATGHSAPTLSRKMTSLERQTGRRLFLRGNKGYVLTSDGRSLRDEAAALVQIRRRLAAWTATDEKARIRITAGTWTSRWLAQNLVGYWSAQAAWVPEFLASNAVLDIARREADIGFRNVRPEQSWLARRRLRRIEYAEYGAGEHVTGFVALAEHLATAPSMRWVHRNRADRLVTTVSDVRLQLDLTRAGAVRAVLPTFAGDAESGLMRLSDPIGELTHDEWLVTHHDARHDPPVRAAIDAITRFMEDRNR